MEYKISVEAFEGPMDLLLHLIDKTEIDIYDIPINKISEQFIQYIKSMEELNLEVTGEFLLMAATLLEIKSKMLLPSEVKSQGQQLEMEELDPRAELVRRIVEYKKYKDAAAELREYEDLYSKIFSKPKEEIIDDSSEDIEISGMDVGVLLKYFNNMIKKSSKSSIILEISEVQREEYTLKACMKNIKDILREKEFIKFDELFDVEYTSKPEIIAYFLSVLELIAIKYIEVKQSEEFSDLIIFKLDEKR